MVLRPSQASDAPEVRTHGAQRSLAVLNACRPGAWAKVGGIPLTARG
jgi:hypothetical protein